MGEMRTSMSRLVSRSSEAIAGRAGVPLCQVQSVQDCPNDWTQVRARVHKTNLVEKDSGPLSFIQSFDIMHALQPSYEGNTAVP